MAALEQAALNGTLFQPRSPSPRRHSIDSDSDSNRSANSDSLTSSPPPHPYASASAAPAAPPRRGAQTGPKGVMADRRSAQTAAAAQSRADLRAVRAQQERAAITAPTAADDELARKIAQAALEDEDEDSLRGRWREQRLLAMAAGRGGLREVDAGTFLGAVERKGWALVLIYEPDIPRCLPLLAEATRLARQGTAIVRARANALGFGTATKKDRTTVVDQYDDGDDEAEADPDVLPTLLAYRDGELERTWVRVDFDVGSGGLVGLLAREGIVTDDFEHSDSE